MKGGKMPGRKKTPKQTEEKEELEVIVPTREVERHKVVKHRMVRRFARLNPVGVGIGFGIIGALFVSLTTVAAIFGYFPMTASFLMDIYGYFGYSISVLGIVLGAIYGFVDCFIIGALFAVIYNSVS